MNNIAPPPSYDASINRHNQIPFAGYGSMFSDQETFGRTLPNTGYTATTASVTVNLAPQNTAQPAPVVHRRTGCCVQSNRQPVPQNASFWTRTSTRWRNAPFWLRFIVFWFFFSAVGTLIWNVVRASYTSDKKDEDP